jgi:hypothetical protein
MFFYRSIVLDYGIEINELRQEDRIFVGGPLGNYSLAGFEMILVRHISHYIINYYLPSGENNSVNNYSKLFTIVIPHF